jgi:hypothetical protein
MSTLGKPEVQLFLAGESGVILDSFVRRKQTLVGCS